MLSLNELLAPITLDQFRADYEGRKPLHIPAGSDAGKRALLDWAGFNRLLSQTAIWNATNLKLVHNGEPIPPEQYCIEARSQSGVTLQPSPAKVETLMAMGASVIAGDVQSLTPEIQSLSQTLGREWAALVGANVYCSFGGVQAFGTHFDLHDVFAIQTEGEKTWKLYANRAEAPVDFPGDGPDVRRWLTESRGPLMQEVRMRPGDVLYLPRGWYHDALATEGASLHVTFSITPLYGRILFRLLESAAMQDPAFRAWLAPASRDEGAPLQKQLAALGQKLAALAAHPQFRDEVAMAQERLTPRPTTYALPQRKTLTFFSRTGLRPPPMAGPAAVAVEWMISQPRFAIEDMIAQFDFVAEPALRDAVAALEKAGALKRL
ncbi:MAG: cupin domain-containing protein [Pseudomonadota bacterium]